jgi:hypothetical protein
MQRALDELKRNPERVQRMLDDAIASGNVDEITFAYRLWRETQRKLT